MSEQFYLWFSNVGSLAVPFIFVLIMMLKTRLALLHPSKPVEPAPPAVLDANWLTVTALETAIYKRPQHHGYYPDCPFGEGPPDCQCAACRRRRRGGAGTDVALVNVKPVKVAPVSGPATSAAPAPLDARERILSELRDRRARVVEQATRIANARRETALPQTMAELAHFHNLMEMVHELDKQIAVLGDVIEVTALGDPVPRFIPRHPPPPHQGRGKQWQAAYERGRRAEQRRLGLPEDPE